MNKKIVGLLIIILCFISLFSGCLDQGKNTNKKPFIEISYPQNAMNLFDIVPIYGNASDPDGNNTLVKVEVKIDNGNWSLANGLISWSYNWSTFDLKEGLHSISARSSDGSYYSNVISITVEINNPKDLEFNTHKWAVFVIAANFPIENTSKLGNGGLYLAENMTSFFIENLSYSTSNIAILFDDGWIRSDNGYGKPIETLQQRPHPYNITYEGATTQNLSTILQNVIEESNQFDDSEVFIWIFNHGYGDETKKITGGKVLQHSIVSLWDGPLSDQGLGNMLSNLKSKKTCIIIDACYSGGFADKTIYNLPEFFLLKSGIAKPGRIVISGTSKFRLGYALTTFGPIFSLIWFYGFETGYADGFKPGLFNMGRPTTSKDGTTSVEESFYYACYVLRHDKNLVNFKMMEPQMNDQYPGKGLFKRISGMLL